MRMFVAEATKNSRQRRRPEVFDHPEPHRSFQRRLSKLPARSVDNFQKLFGITKHDFSIFSQSRELRVPFK
jgi:hypothetical protein